MINGIETTGSPRPTTGAAAALPAAPTAQPATPGGQSFSDLLKSSIDEVARLQQDASQATQALLTGQTEDITGVFTAMEKSDIAFKTLLAIRGKLMDAYEEIKNMPI